jgi:ABC-type histidine transport system ATPase subunit
VPERPATSGGDEVLRGIGPSDSGRSALFRCVNLWEEPTKGRFDLFRLAEEAEAQDGG